MKTKVFKRFALSTIAGMVCWILGFASIVYIGFEFAECALKKMVW